MLHFAFACCWARANIIEYCFNCVSAVMETEDSDYLYNARQRMSTLSSCFAQLTHKAQTIFQNSAKVEVRKFSM